MDKESRLLTDEIVKALDVFLGKPNNVNFTFDWNRKIQNVAEYITRLAQDTKSVKARDKEWVEWLEYALFEVLSGKDIKELIQSRNWFKCREWVIIGIKQKLGKP